MSRRVALLPLLLLALLLLAPPAAVAQGRNVVHLWQREFYGELDGRQRLLFGPRLERNKPALGDLDGDGDLDLVLGTAAGQLLYFENQGEPGQPRWILLNESLAAETGPNSGQTAPIDVGDNAAPVLVDLDSDGDLDLLVGAASGKLALYRNSGNRFLPVFELENPDYLGRSFGLNLVPRFADVNGDGNQDLTLGNEDGRVILLLNQGTRRAPRFCVEEPAPLDCLAVPRELASIAPEDNAAPTWVDWDGDGDLDLMVGKNDGRIAHYRNIGTSREGVWELAEARFNIIDAGGFAAPVFRNLTGQGRPDLLLAGDGERIALYSNRPAGRGSELWLETENVLGVTSLGRFQTRLVAAGSDVDGDGDQDLFLGTRGGALMYYENVGGKDRIALKSHPDLLPTPNRSHTAPTLVDFDGDGDQDLILGDANGRLELIRNVGTAKAPRWAVANVFLAQVDVGAMSVPVFEDVDGDGDADLISGNSLGRLIFYENEGSRTQLDLVLRSTGFAGLRVAAQSAPAFFHWDAQQPPDVVTGNLAGSVVSATRNPAVPVTAGSAWQASSTPWSGIGAEAQSVPRFIDLSNDGRADLLLGGRDGTLLLWRNAGSVSPDQIASRPDRRMQNALALSSLPDSRRSAAATGAGGAARPVPEPSAPTRPDYLEPVFESDGMSLEPPVRERNTFPAMADLTGDKLPDLAVGTAAGHVYLYRNVGAQDGPVWQRMGVPLKSKVPGRNAAPALADLDGDGDQDLLVGIDTGRMEHWRNAGTATAPRFELVTDALAGVRGQRNPVPLVMDVDGDGTLDLMVGDLKGQLFYYRGMPGAVADFRLEQRRFLSLNVGINASPAVGNLTLNRSPVLLVGSDQGQITILQRTSTSSLRSSGWKQNPRFLEGLQMPPGSHPALGDVDGDGDLDLVVGSDKGALLFFRNLALNPQLARTQ